MNKERFLNTINNIIVYMKFCRLYPEAINVCTSKRFLYYCCHNNVSIH